MDLIPPHPKKVKDRIVVYTDGACENNQCLQSNKRRAGVGVWYGTDDERNISEPLEGIRQTNNRAEMVAVIRVLEKNPKDIKVQVWTDSEIISKKTVKLKGKWGASKNHLRSLKNGDLWLKMADQMEERVATTEVYHCFGHCDIRGNEMGDKLAVE